ncbi:MAG: hypothetical protein IT204_17315 [Fimbriimonadaceae bacterium]|nr:hypothetical protein [Fimbriimonadaceae bacterium]
MSAPLDVFGSAARAWLWTHPAALRRPGADSGQLGQLADDWLRQPPWIQYGGGAELSDCRKAAWQAADARMPLALAALLGEAQSCFEPTRLEGGLRCLLTPADLAVQRQIWPLALLEAAASASACRGGPLVVRTALPPPRQAARLAPEGLLDGHVHLGAGAPPNGLTWAAIQRAELRDLPARRSAAEARWVVGGEQLQLDVLLVAARWGFQTLERAAMEGCAVDIVIKRDRAFAALGSSLDAYWEVLIAAAQTDPANCGKSPAWRRVYRFAQRVRRGSLPPDGERCFRERVGAALHAWFQSHPWPAEANCHTVLLTQVLRIIGVIYRGLVALPDTQSFDLFDAHFAAWRKVKKHAEADLVQAALRWMAARPAIRGVEWRVGPEKTVDQLRTEFRSKVKSCEAYLHDRDADGNPARFLTARFAIHLLREPDRRPRRGAYVHPVHLRFEGLWQQARAVGQFLAKRPNLTRWVGTVDIAGNERSLANWVMALLVNRTWTYYYSLCGPAAPRLSFICHAGEGFDTQLQGLRRLDELTQRVCFDGVRLHPQRVGHALALSHRPCDTAVRVDRQELVDDLVWLWARAREALSQRCLAQLEDRLAAEASDPNGDGRSPQTLWQAYQLRYEPTALARVGLLAEAPRHWRLRRHVHAPDNLPTECDRLLARYLTRPLAGTVPLSELPWLPEATAAAREVLLRDLAQLDLTVEVCPTSNLRIGAMRSLQEHPVFDWSPPHSSALRFTVNTDDPSLFDSAVDEEYEALLQAALARGQTYPEAREWLQRSAAAAADDSGSDQPWPTDREQFGQLLDRCCRELAGRRRRA